MSLKEKVGQLFQIGFQGTEITPEIEAMIQDYHIGGIIYFRRNIESPEQLAHLSNSLQERALKRGFPLLISSDEEGGIVRRLQGGIPFPGAMAMGATGDEALVRKVGGAMGQELRAVGINMNLAPVLDVNNNDANPVIGVRSFGEDTMQVARLGCAFMEGLQREGSIACGKHFPGHGDTGVDSHLDLPVIPHDLARLEKVEFVPFQHAMDRGLDSIMTAHIYFPALESEENLPATLSYKVLTGLLRQKMGFKGLIVTDCMEMEAITTGFGTVEGAVKTLEAGSSMVLISHNLQLQKAAMDAVLQRVRSGGILEEVLDRAVQQVLSLKEKRIGLAGYTVAHYSDFDREYGEEVARTVARQGVTLYRDESGRLPLQPGDRAILLEFAAGNRTQVENRTEPGNALAPLLRERGLIVKEILLDQDCEDLPPLQGQEHVLCIIPRGLDEDRMKKLNTLAVDPIIIATGSPYDCRTLTNTTTCLITYDQTPYMMEAAADILLGRDKARGILPVTL